MKKLLLLAGIAIFAVACVGSSPKPAGVAAAAAPGCLTGAPDWVLSGGAEGEYLNGVGSAKIGPAGVQFARTAAQGSARDEMARTLEVKVENMLKDFTQQTGVGDSAVVDRVTANVSKQVSSQTLTGTKQKAMWASPCNELYVLMAADANTLQKSVKDSVNSSLKNEAAAWQQFQAKGAQDELDAAVNKSFPKQ
ncbi:hypothetical protein RsTz2092_02370 [Deferribacterales bacterium RsTz2092]|nr:hypothetical protein AGMMS49941_08430 [Deferribacterales bacterium]